MFTTLVLIIHVIVCIALILIILLQSGKGADIGAVFGGGSSQTVFGSTGASTFLSKVTIGAAVVFMMTSIILTYFSGRGGMVTERSIVTEQSAPEAPMTTPAPGSEASQPVEGTPQPQSVPKPAESAPAPTSAPSGEKPAETK
ncbi:MAG: preprotein translocase subunit SecG [Desulfomonilaceae bacterium]